MDLGLLVLLGMLLFIALETLHEHVLIDAKVGADDRSDFCVDRHLQLVDFEDKFAVARLVLSVETLPPLAHQCPNRLESDNMLLDKSVDAVALLVTNQALVI